MDTIFFSVLLLLLLLLFFHVSLLYLFTRWVVLGG